MQYNWKITYMDCNGSIVSTIFKGTLFEIGSFCPPTGNNSSILKVEKVSND